MAFVLIPHLDLFYSLVQRLLQRVQPGVELRDLGGERGKLGLQGIRRI